MSTHPIKSKELEPSLNKASCESGRGVTSVFLLPANCGTIWWHPYVVPHAWRSAPTSPSGGNCPLLTRVWRDNMDVVVEPDLMEKLIHLIANHQGADPVQVLAAYRSGVAVADEVTVEKTVSGSSLTDGSGQFSLARTSPVLWL